MENFFCTLPKDETAFSRMLGAILKRDPNILKTLYRRISGKIIPKAELDSMVIDVEVSDNGNRYDVLCLSSSYCIVIETKIRGAVVEEKQFNLYITELAKRQKKENVFIAITDSPFQKTYPFQNGFEMYAVNWLEIDSLFKGKSLTIDVMAEYRKLMEEELEMAQYDIEVWAVVAKDAQETNLKQHHVYFNGNRHNPAFIARRDWNAGLGRVAIQSLYPVLEIIDKDDPNFAAKVTQQGVAQNDIIPDCHMYIVGDEVALANPSKATFSNTQSSAVSVDFKDL